MTKSINLKILLKLITNSEQTNQDRLDHQMKNQNNQDQINILFLLICYDPKK